jgi:microcystin-dependent protein
MAFQPFVGQIVLYAFDFAPTGWALCQGQLLPISQNTALFSILGTTFGGNGTSNFALPDLRSRIPVHAGQGSGLSNYVLGEQQGTESVTLLTANMPSHGHSAVGTNNPGDSPTPAGNSWATGTGGGNQYAGTAGSQMSAQALGVTGNSQPHNNIMPVLAMNYCIALVGLYPTRN